ncbi:MAG: transposase [bacterium]
MARIARIVIPGHPHHVTQRGVRSQDVFFSAQNRIEYLHLLSSQGSRHGVTFLAYCLMSNHIHLIAVPSEEKSLARAIGEAHRRYTFNVNSVQDVRGYLFQGRFYSCPLDERHLYAAVRYIERNPVRAGLAQEPWDYTWSSAAWRVGLKDKDPLVKESLYLEEMDWREFLTKDTEKEMKDCLQKKVKTGRICGNNDFVERAEELTGRILRFLPRGRPRLNNK